jgi:hypothetical protein
MFVTIQALLSRRVNKSHVVARMGSGFMQIHFNKEHGFFLNKVRNGMIRSKGSQVS